MGRRATKSAEGPLYLFHHIPKSAGSTVEYEIARRFPSPQSITMNFKADTKHEVWAHLVRARPHCERLASIQGHRVFHGLHEVAPDRPARYFTFLRDPVDRVVSLYNFWAEKPERRSLMAPDGELIPFADFIEQPAAQNNTLRFLAHAMEGGRAPGSAVESTTESVEAGRRFLDLCWFVGLVETFDEDFAVVASAMGLSGSTTHRNVSKWFLDPRSVDAVRDRLLELNAADTVLYEHARALRDR